MVYLQKPPSSVVKNIPKTVCLIPARLKSTRLPEKLKIQIRGKSILEWTYKNAKQLLDCGVIDDLVIAVDNPDLSNLVDSFGGKWVMTEKCPNGTHRVLKCAENLQLDPQTTIINIQGDTCVLDTDNLANLIQILNNPRTYTKIGTMYYEYFFIPSPNKVKLIKDYNNKVLYFSRANIPHNSSKYFIHAGIYVYKLSTLQKIVKLPTPPYFVEEFLEQLAWLYGGYKIQCISTNRYLSIDIEEDLDKFNQYLSKQKNI